MGDSGRIRMGSSRWPLRTTRYSTSVFSTFLTLLLFDLVAPFRETQYARMGHELQCMYAMTWKKEWRRGGSSAGLMQLLQLMGMGSDRDGRLGIPLP